MHGKNCTPNCIAKSRLIGGQKTRAVLAKLRRRGFPNRSHTSSTSCWCPTISKARTSWRLGSIVNIKSAPSGRMDVDIEAVCGNDSAHLFAAADMGMEHGTDIAVRFGGAAQRL